MRNEKTHYYIQSDRETLLHYISYLYLNFICLEKILSCQNKGEISWLFSGTADKARKMDQLQQAALFMKPNCIRKAKRIVPTNINSNKTFLYNKVQRVNEFPFQNRTINNNTLDNIGRCCQDLLHIRLIYLFTILGLKTLASTQFSRFKTACADSSQGVKYKGI